MRSLLFVPAHKSGMIEKALKSEADAIIFDLEDSCPEDQRAKGIENINEYGPATCNKTIVRISDWKQIDQVKSIDFIMYPKFEGYKIRLNAPPAIILIESARGVISLPSTIQNNPLIRGIAFGNEDYLADTGCSDYSFARNMVMNCAKAYGKFAIDTVHTNVHDIIELCQECNRAYSQGFDGKLCIHPKEIFTVNAFFIPNEQEYNHAQKIIELSTEGVSIIDGIFIAPPMVKRAEKIISKYEYYTQKHQDDNRIA